MSPTSYLAALLRDAHDRIRTGDLPLDRRVLSLLSYMGRWIREELHLYIVVFSHALFC